MDTSRRHRNDTHLLGYLGTRPGWPWRLGRVQSDWPYSAGDLEDSLARLASAGDIERDNGRVSITPEGMFRVSGSRVPAVRAAAGDVPGRSRLESIIQDLRLCRPKAVSMRHGVSERFVVELREVVGLPCLVLEKAEAHPPPVPLVEVEEEEAPPRPRPERVEDPPEVLPRTAPTRSRFAAARARRARIVLWMRDQGGPVTSNEVSDAMDIDHHVAYSDLKRLRDMGQVRCVGRLEHRRRPKGQPPLGWEA